MPVKPVPEGYHTLTPYVLVDNASEFIEFLTEAFDADEIDRASMPDGKIMHAAVQIGDSRMMISDPPLGHKPLNSMFYLYVDDVDAYFNRAIKAGATSVQDPADAFYGDRAAGLKDAFGNHWWVATHIEDVSKEELTRRMQAQGR